MLLTQWFLTGSPASKEISINNKQWVLVILTYTWKDCETLEEGLWNCTERSSVLLSAVTYSTLHMAIDNYKIHRNRILQENVLFFVQKTLLLHSCFLSQQSKQICRTTNLLTEMYCLVACNMSCVTLTLWCFPTCHHPNINRCLEYDITLHQQRLNKQNASSLH